MMEHGEVEIMSSSAIQLSFKVFEPETVADPNLNPVVFLHGLTSCKETWKDIPQLIANATSRRAYSFDLRNHGDSEWHEDFTVEDLVDDLGDFLKLNQISRAVLIGHSLGGTISINFALEFPEKVELIIVEDMYAGPPTAALCAIPLAYTRLAPAAVNMIPIGTDEEAATKFIMEFVAQSCPAPSGPQPMQNKIDKSTMALKRTEDGRYMLKANMPVIENSLRRVVDGEPATKEIQGTYDGPACFVYGEISHFEVGKRTDHIKKFFPKAEFFEIKNARHTVHNDCPETFLNTISSFLSRYSIQ